MADPFRVLVADDHPLFLFAVAHSLKLRPELALAGQAQTGREAIRLALETRPELAVLDMQMPDLSGLEVLHRLIRAGLRTRVLFLSGHLSDALAYELVAAGASGVMSKDATPGQIAEALMRIAAGEKVLADDVQAALVRHVRERGDRGRVQLSPREQEVLGFLASGLSAPQIAAELHLSPSTVKTHLKRLYERLEVRDRAAAVAEGMRRGLIR